ncbi:hypothetical protein [Methylobacter sp. S3L5C]|uniref:hypothetical protein n=1 Tax=Methylobacter sp. S3L5C TaxID=2839024 RepID=UPI001FAB8023|nr:hypothetical protein [Methylobacter sp. S3L5C]UOA08433.1 hypothetical protein KKZ03_19910 [Methylobacter sp. S3L5C]
MNIRQIAFTGATIMLLATMPAWAGGVNGNNGVGNNCQGNSCGGGQTAQAPCVRIVVASTFKKK